MIIERFNQIIRDKISKWIIANKTKKWITVLPSIVNSYETTVHSATGLTPQEARQKGFFNMKAFDKKEEALNNAT